MATWTDNPATSSTHVRSIHINEIRATVDNDRRQAGLSPYGWTDDPLTTGTHIRAIHFTEIRTAIQQVPGARTLPNWSVGNPPSPSRQISARDINDLRSWTDQLSAAVGQQFGPAELSHQGIVSFSYDPDANGGAGATVSDQWCQDLGTAQGAGLKPNGDALLVRAVISARSSDNTLGSPGYPEYKAAMDTWVRNGFPVAAVLPPEFDRPGTSGSTFCPNAALGKNNNPLLNDYIDDWSFRAADFAGQLASHGLTTYWLWNEPNTDGSIAIGANCPAGSVIPGTQPPQNYHPTSLSPQNFAAILYQGCTRIKSAVSQAVTYAGSLSVLPGTDVNGPYVAGYLDAMYRYLNLNLVHGPYPWDALSLNMEGYPDSSFIASAISAIQAKQRQYGDTNDGTSTGTPKPLLIGEWGVRNRELDPTRARPTYNALRMAFPKAMYFFEHPDFLSNHDSTDYGARDWNIQSGQYVLADQLLWWDVLHSYYQTP